MNFNQAKYFLTPERPTNSVCSIQQEVAMRPQPPGTDYPPRSFYEEWFREAERGIPGKGITFENHPRILAQFDTNIDKFAANVAFALAHRLFYRTDGGKRARGFVRYGDNFEEVHYFLVTKGRQRSRDVVALGVTITRRMGARASQSRDGKSAAMIAPDQTALKLAFLLSISDMHLEETTVTTKGPEKLRLDACGKALTLAKAVVDKVSYYDKPRGAKYNQVVRIAREWKCPSCLSHVWYYRASHVTRYLLSDNLERQKMTQASAGLTPFILGEDHFRSQLPGRGDAGGWKVFPFDRMVKNSGGKSDAEFEDFIEREFIYMDQNINASADAVREQQRKYILAGGSSDPLAGKFFEHILELQKNKTHIYSETIAVKPKVFGVY